MSLTGIPAVDAIIGGSLSAVAGYVTNKLLKRRTKREFWKVGGQTIDEALSESRDAQADGWIPIGPPKAVAFNWGRDICEYCWFVNDSAESIAECPECGEVVWQDRHSDTLFEVDLYRDV